MEEEEEDVTGSTIGRAMGDDSMGDVAKAFEVWKGDEVGSPALGPPADGGDDGDDE